MLSVESDAVKKASEIVNQRVLKNQAVWDWLLR
jgi:hypothetical protein